MKKIMMFLFVLGLCSLQNVYAEIESPEEPKSDEMAGIVVRSTVTLKGPDETLILYSNGSFVIKLKNDDRMTGTYSILDDHTTLALYFDYPYKTTVYCSCKMSRGTLEWVKKGEYYYR